MAYYYIVIVLVTISFLAQGSIFRTKLYSSVLIFLMYCLTVAVVLINPITIDMGRYLGILQENHTLTWFEALARVRWEPGFVTYQWLISKISVSYNIFIIITISLIWLITIKALSRIVSYIYIPLILIGYLSLFYYFNFLRNVIRQGFAVSLIFLMIVFLSENKTKSALFYIILSISFHISAAIGGLLFVIKKLNLSIKFLCVAYLLSAFTMLTGLNQTIMTSILFLIRGRIGSSIARYSSDSIIMNYGTTNRIDFLIFTTFWLVLGLYFYKMFLKNDYFYEWLIKAYLTFSTIFLLIGYIGYSDRIAAYAWHLIPIIIFYPIIKMKSKYKLALYALSIIVCISIVYFFELQSLYQGLKLIY